MSLMAKLSGVILDAWIDGLTTLRNMVELAE